MDITNMGGDTPLHSAVQHGHHDVVAKVCPIIIVECVQCSWYMSHRCYKYSLISMLSMNMATVHFTMLASGATRGCVRLVITRIIEYLIVM